MAARAACKERPRWTAIFTKAYALMAREFPEFRRAYVKLPWHHLYEYPHSNATIIIERDYQRRARPFSISIKEPARQSLREIGRQLEHGSTAPVESIKDFRRTMNFARLPKPIRRAFWWICLNSAASAAIISAPSASRSIRRSSRIAAPAVAADHACSITAS